MSPENFRPEGFQPIEIPRPPEAPEFAYEKPVQFIGEIPVVYATWGHPITDEELKAHFRKAGLLTPKDEKMVDNSDFKQGYYYPFDFDPFSYEFQDRQVSYAAQLAKITLEERDWNKADVLVVASATSRADVAKRTAERLKKDGISVDTALFYGQACNGAIAGITDLCQIEEFRDKQAVVVGLESLSGKFIPATNLQILNFFGNGGGAIAFKPGEEIEHITGRKVVCRNTRVITIPLIYSLPEVVADQFSIRRLYDFVDDESRKAFAVSEDGVFMLMPESKDGYAHMNGPATLRFFVKEMSKLIPFVLFNFEMGYKAEYGALQATVLYHAASYPVIYRLNKETIKSARNLSKEYNVNLFVPDLVSAWRMSQAKVNNISAGTFFVQVAELAEDDGLIKLNKPILVIGMGVGAVLEANVVRFKQT